MFSATDATAPADALVMGPADATAAVAAAEAPADALVMAPAEAPTAVAAAEAPVTRLCKACGVNLPLSMFNKVSAVFSKRHSNATPTPLKRASFAHLLRL